MPPSQTKSAAAREAYRRQHPALMEHVPEIRAEWPAPGAAADDLTRARFLIACELNHAEQIAYYLHVFPDAHGWRNSFGAHGRQKAAAHARLQQRIHGGSAYKKFKI